MYCDYSILAVVRADEISWVQHLPILDQPHIGAKHFSQLNYLDSLKSTKDSSFSWSLDESGKL